MSYLSKSSKKKQASIESKKVQPRTENIDNVNPVPGISRRTLTIIGGAIICLLIVCIGLYILLQPGAPQDQIVGTWTDDNNYWAYAYYPNGSISELGWYTVHNGAERNHVPVYMSGKWTNISDNHYQIVQNGNNSTSYEAVINSGKMTVLNLSNSDTHKISNRPDVNQVRFNYPE